VTKNTKKSSMGIFLGMFSFFGGSGEAHLERILKKTKSKIDPNS
jgi:hypothetical protein